MSHAHSLSDCGLTCIDFSISRRHRALEFVIECRFTLKIGEQSRHQYEDSVKPNTHTIKVSKDKSVR